MLSNAKQQVVLIIRKMLINQWIKMERDNGRMADRYDYWMLGKTGVGVAHRWSVMRDILHWQ